CHCPVASTIALSVARITTVRTSVARSALMLATPTLPKIAVSAAKAAESNAQGSHEIDDVGIVPPCVIAKEGSQRFGPGLSTRNLVAVPACVPHIADGALMTAVRSLVLLTLSLVLLAPLPDPASAETFPNHAVTVVVPFPPGGPTDAL